jgi:hypothetical protein
MSREKAIIGLREVLQELYEDVDEAKRIVRAAGLKTTSIKWGGSARTHWFHILDEAEKHNKLDVLLQVVQNDDGADNLKFQQAYQTYLTVTGQSKPPEQHRPEKSAPRPVKILFLAANPSDTDPLQLADEMRAIKEILRKTPHYERFRLEQEWAVRYSDLPGLLMEHQPDIVHFSGHGGSAGELKFLDENGFSHPIAVPALTQLFTLLKDNIRCVVLNACYSESQAQAIAKQIDAVIGVRKELEDESALHFAAGFYEALGFGRDVKKAFDLGCSRIDVAGLPDAKLPRLLAPRSDPTQLLFVGGR